MADETPSTGFFSRPPQRPAPPPFRPPAPPDPAPTPGPAADTPPVELGDTGPHPWRRYFARCVDFFVGAFLFGIVAALAVPAFAEVHTVMVGILSLVVWTFVEALLLSTWGTTPGKRLFGLTVRTRQGAMLDFGAALGRVVKVWVRGLGLGIPIVSLITVILAYNRLKNQGDTSWDADGGFEVIYR